MPSRAVAKVSRRNETADSKRERIRAATRKVLLKRGLSGTSLRVIAKQAGCTTGAIYAQYRNKEAIFGDLLQQSLSEMLDAIQATLRLAKDEHTGPVIRTIFASHDTHPAEFDLAIYLQSGARKIRFPPDLNSAVKTRAQAIVGIVANCLIHDRACPRKAAPSHAILLMVTIFGLLLMDKNGRLKSHEHNARALLETLIGLI